MESLERSFFFSSALVVVVVEVEEEAEEEVEGSACTAAVPDWEWDRWTDGKPHHVKPVATAGAGVEALRRDKEHYSVLYSEGTMRKKRFLNDWENLPDNMSVVNGSIAVQEPDLEQSRHQ
ncbi:hypothetical protein EYF80_024357 [Liparis tanakae]|uniref:Uncharacterized protein n=1 Tax=Liparis tanakae TaxID=230148 RepID=A0A4Z2HHV5_9TELE|nr:hypothetical protein EYF80_024357 [Liparis tanakae]